MTTKAKIILAAVIVILIIIGVVLYKRSKKPPVTPPAKTAPPVKTEPGTGKKVVSQIHNGLEPDLAGPDTDNGGGNAVV